MDLRRIIKAAEVFEDSSHPLLGPNLKGLCFFGYWLSGSKLRNFFYHVMHIMMVIIIMTAYLELYMLRKDLAAALMNFSITGLGTITISKLVIFIPMRTKWMDLVHLISKEELSAIDKKDSNVLKIMAEYTKYSRTVTYFFWILAFWTGNIAVTTPAMKYLTMTQYRERIQNGTEPYPQIMSTWVPFNKNKMPGYSGCLAIHTFCLIFGSGIVAVYDTYAVTLLIFLKGQAKIIRYKCRTIFGENNLISEEEVLSRIGECHRHHNYLRNVYEQINSLLSPVMFMYVLVCSISICCNVVQLSLDILPAQKLWVYEYTFVQVCQLFLYCWHSNEVAVETDAISSGCFESNWWRSSPKQRKMLVLLMGKMNQRYILTAGPFTSLSVPVFIDIIKGSYSFYTLFMQLQDK